MARQSKVHLVRGRSLLVLGVLGAGAAVVARRLRGPAPASPGFPAPPRPGLVGALPDDLSGEPAGFPAQRRLGGLPGHPAMGPPTGQDER